MCICQNAAVRSVAVRVGLIPPPASAPTVAILVAHMQLIVTVPSVASLVVPTYPVALARSVAVWVSKPHIKQTRFWESRGAMKKGRLTHLPSELKDIVADHQQLKSAIGAAAISSTHVQAASFSLC